MKNRIFPILILLIITSFNFACKEGAYGKKVKEPMSGSNYESNNRYFRAVGKGVSVKDNIASGKADIDAKNTLAGQVNTNIKNVTDQYLAQTENEKKGEVADKFQSLVRQVMNTSLSDLRKFDEKKFFDGENYTVFVAYEIHKKSMFKFIKKQAETENDIDKKTLKLIDDILEKEIKKLELEEGK